MQRKNEVLSVPACCCPGYVYINIKTIKQNFWEFQDSIVHKTRTVPQNLEKAEVHGVKKKL